MDRAELIEKANKLAAERVTPDMDMDEKMDVLEMAMMELLDVQIMKPPIGRVGTFASGGPTPASGQWLMHFDPRLPEMPDKPTLMDFFRSRLLLDFSTVGFIRTDHGHWGAQIVAPYVDEEVAWAIKHHQSLRFLPAPELGYEYPKLYTRAFGEKYGPPEYIKAEWDYCRNHKWYMSAMQVVLNDLYAFDPNVKDELEEFEDIIGRNFKQPAEGLGFDGSPVAHMWRTMIWPNNFL